MSANQFYMSLIDDLRFPGESVLYLNILLLAILLTLGMMISVLNDAFINRRHRKIMLIICALIFALIAQNYADMLLQTRYTNIFVRTVYGIIGYSLRPVILVLFCYIVDTKRKLTIAWVLVGLNAAVYMTALFSRIAFWISQNNHFHRGPLNLFSFVVSTVLLMHLLYLSIRESRSENRRKNHILLLPVLMIIGAVFMDYLVGTELQPITFLTSAIILSSVFYYIWLHRQFVQTHEKALIDGQRIQIMISQIRPHFLYNALGSIEALCERDPKAAMLATRKFSQYLRGNMNSLTREQLIPFEEELQHTRIYLELEQIRFGDALDVDYDIAALWDEPKDRKAMKQRVRNCVNDLKNVLHSIGMDEALIRQSSHVAVNPELLDCDYYRMLAGDMAAVNAFRGEYMEQYSWAELTKGILTFRTFRT